MNDRNHKQDEHRAVIVSQVEGVKGLPDGGLLFVEVCRCGSLRVRVELPNRPPYLSGWRDGVDYEDTVGSAKCAAGLSRWS